MSAEIGARIRRARLERGFKGVEVARQVGIGRSYYSLIESGQRGFSAELLSKIAQALGVSCSELCGETAPASDTSARTGKHLRKLNRGRARRSLRPMLGDQTDDAVDMLELWLEAPEEMKQLLTEKAEQARAGRASKRGKEAGGRAA